MDFKHLSNKHFLTDVPDIINTNFEKVTEFANKFTEDTGGSINLNAGSIKISGVSQSNSVRTNNLVLSAGGKDVTLTGEVLNDIIDSNATQDSSISTISNDIKTIQSDILKLAPLDTVNEQNAAISSSLAEQTTLINNNINTIKTLIGVIPADAEYTNITEQLESITESISLNEEKLDILVEDSSTLKDSVTSLQSEIDAIKTDIETINTAISDINTILTTHGEVMQSIQEGVQDLKDYIDYLLSGDEEPENPEGEEEPKNQ